MLQQAKEKQPDRELEVLLEAARRAVWDATKGPPHLRSGKFNPEAELKTQGQRDTAD